MDGTLPACAVSLAHHGMLFLDERPAFRRHILEMLCQPLETGVARIRSLARPRHERLGHAGGAGRAPDRLARHTVIPHDAAKSVPGVYIPVDKPVQHPYTCTTPPCVGGSCHLVLSLAEMRERADASRLDRPLLQASRHTWLLSSSPMSPEAPTPDPRLIPPCEEGDPSGSPGFARLRRDRCFLVVEDRA
jgi:hypothetical protein